MGVGESSSHSTAADVACLYSAELEGVNSASVLASENCDATSRQQVERQSSALIDNSGKVYIPVRLKCGVHAFCEPQVLSSCPGALGDLNRDLVDCFEILPTNLHALILRTKVWINLTHRIGQRANPKILNHTTAHHHQAWLVWARDRPEKKLGIEIYNCSDYQRMRLHWNGCGLILHELSHLIHQLTLPDGLENTAVKEAFARAQASEKYEQVLRRDWAGKDIDCDLAYAMVDHREFFAEMSVAYWSSQGYQELDQEIHSTMIKASPPIVAPSVHSNIAQRRDEFRKWLDGGKVVNVRKTMTLSHCNKFYPFTRGQLKHYDKDTFQALESIWHEIALWEDPHRADEACCCINNCWHYRFSKRQNAVDALVGDTIEL